MARRTFDVTDVAAILRNWYAGHSLTSIALRLGVDRKTVRKYVRVAVETGLSPGGPPVGDSHWADLAHSSFPELADGRLRQHTWSELDRHYDYIASALAVQPQSAVWQRLRAEHGLACSVASFRRYVAANVPDHRPPGGTAPDHRADVEYGLLGHWVDPATGHTRRVWAFVMVLARSRHMYLRPVLTIDQQSWIDAHVAAFSFFGGVPRRLAPGGLHAEAKRLWDPSANPSFGRLAARYRVELDATPVIPRAPRTMTYVRRHFWAGNTFDSPDRMLAGAVAWCHDVAGQRNLRTPYGATPLRLFEREERPALRPLPPSHPAARRG